MKTKAIFFIQIVFFLLLTHLSQAQDKPTSKKITGVFVDIAHIRHDGKSHGDTWDHIWTDEDSLYTFACDGRGYGTAYRNINFNRLTGTTWDQLTGSSVNSMDAYGTQGQKIADSSNWKVTGADCIDGVIYAFVAKNWYGKDNAYGSKALDPYIRQTVNNMSLIKSTDKGLSWSRDVKENSDHPMWTNKKFSTAFFFKYGQNGGSTKQDDQDKYVYAISNDGYWNCGTAFYLGRVPRLKIGSLNPADWQYWSDGQWVANLDKAKPVPGFPTGEMKCTMGSPVWLASIRKYVTVTWYDPGTTIKWHYPEDVTFAFYQADHPWGPWSYIGKKSACEFIADTREPVNRWYGPSLNPKFITNHPDGSVTVVMTFSGQLWDDIPNTLYKNNSCPVTFYTKTQPSLLETVNDTAAKYSDGWNYQTKLGHGDYRDDLHVTNQSGATCDFIFKGEGIEVLSEKYSDLGEVEVILDGVSQGSFSLYQDPMPRLYQIPFYRNLSLPPGQHSIQIVNRAPDSQLCVIDGFRIYGGN